MSDVSSSSVGRNNQGFSQEEQIRALLEKINAYIEQYHGGSVEMISLEGRRLEVRLGGACLGCPLSPTTLHGWVAGTVHQFFPEVEVVESDPLIR